MSEKLKPCPFCGGKAKVRGREGTGEGLARDVRGAGGLRVAHEPL